LLASLPGRRYHDNTRISELFRKRMINLHTPLVRFAIGAHADVSHIGVVGRWLSPQGDKTFAQ